MCWMSKWFCHDSNHTTEHLTVFHGQGVSHYGIETLE